MVGKGTQLVAGMKGHPKSDRAWPNPKPEIEGDKWDDSIADNGTDYIGKSFTEHASEHPVIVEGANASPLIKGVLDGIGEMFEGMERSLNAEIDQVFGDFGEYDQHLGEAVLSIGKSVSSVGSRVASLQKSISDDVGMPSEQIPPNVAVMEKGGFNQGPEFDYDEVLEAMTKSAIQGDSDVTPLDVQKFELTKGNYMPERVAKSIGLV
jgi:hypothetical protein